MNYDLSVVTPIFNEEENIETLYSKLTEVLQTMDLRYEIIMVDDGSTDDSRRILRDLHSRDSSLKVILLRKNFGQHPATFAGFAHATGNIVITMDADLQNDPADIPTLLEKMEEGYDVVCGWRKDRKDPLISRRLPSLIVNKFISRNSHVNIHDYGCFLRAYKNDAAKEIVEYGVIGGWFPVLFGTLGFDVAEVEVRHHPRAGGAESKHSLFMRIEQFVSVFMGVATKPFQLIEMLGGLSILVGIATEIWLVILWLFTGASVNIIFALFGFSLILWGFTIGVISLIGEYIVRMNYEISKKPKYLIREILK